MTDLADTLMTINVVLITGCLLLAVVWLTLRVMEAAARLARFIVASASPNLRDQTSPPASLKATEQQRFAGARTQRSWLPVVAPPTRVIGPQLAECMQRAAVDNLQRAEIEQPAVDNVQRAEIEQRAAVDNVQRAEIEQRAETPVFPETADSQQRAVAEQGSATPPSLPAISPTGLTSKKQGSATPLAGLPGGPRLTVGRRAAPMPRHQGSASQSALRTEVSASRSASEQGPATPAPTTQGSAKRSAVRTEDAGQRGPAAARERARPFAELYARWHLSEIKNGDPIARDDIWVYAGRLSASSGASLPARDNFFAALYRVPGVTRISDTRVPITTKAGCPIKKTTAYVIKKQSRPDVRAVGSASRTAAPPNQAASASRL